MQSFIINIPEEKVDFFLELAQMLDFEVLEIEEDDFEIEEGQPDLEEDQEPSAARGKKNPSSADDPFLDWDAERQNAKKNKY